MRHSALRNSHLYATSTLEQGCFPDAKHFRARLWAQWGQRAELQRDTWHQLGAADGKALPKGLLQAEGLLRQLPALGHAPSSLLPCHSLTEAREPGPGRCHQVCLLHKAKVGLRYRQLPRPAQPQPHRQEG